MTIEEGIKKLNEIGINLLGQTKPKKVRPYYRCEYCQRRIKKSEIPRHEKYGHKIMRKNN